MTTMTTNHSSWSQMPCVWWPWMCQLLGVGDSPQSVELDLVALEPCRVRGTVVEAGTPFTLRITDDPARRPDLTVLGRWAKTGSAVTILAGRHRRTSWVCLSVGHQRVVPTGVVSDLAAHQTTPEPAGRVVGAAAGRRSRADPTRTTQPSRRSSKETTPWTSMTSPASSAPT
jgi:hypothetical protein